MEFCVELHKFPSLVNCLVSVPIIYFVFSCLVRDYGLRYLKFVVIIESSLMAPHMMQQVTFIHFFTFHHNRQFLSNQSNKASYDSPNSLNQANVRQEINPVWLKLCTYWFHSKSFRIFCVAKLKNYWHVGLRRDWGQEMLRCSEGLNLLLIRTMRKTVYITFLGHEGLYSMLRRY